MRVDLFDFDLPEERIALRPVSPKDGAKLLLVDPQKGFSDKTVSDLPSLLREGDAIVFNDTKVIPAQLAAVRERNGNKATFEATLHKRQTSNRWLAFVRGAKKLDVGDKVEFTCAGGAPLKAKVFQKTDGEIGFEFELNGADLDAAFARVGQIPLPPYIAKKRDLDDADNFDYQTIYADKEGAVAAPTAGLHFTDQMFENLEKAGIRKHFVTLHVGAGTFLPVKADDTEDHKMHFEYGEITQETANALNDVKQNGGRIISVGTTSLRLLESAMDDKGQLKPFKDDTDIFIEPGYQFKFVDMLMTNFHLPKSTLMMLVSAFSGIKVMQDAYKHAIANEYRFYSYGDASLLIRES